ncbi:Nitroreductase NfnB [Pandoraea pneumonica]|jgi:nitroreductase|uniref:Nitroreductase NfnB n=1 Tax=Pandoraea pneumonica TaxID=2508299 RepID=A0A5E4T912_9BURK|nr:nitroreductase [Pandoraea pneumonica]VVD84395.1 Nitroreductase NfnB [Pandoraea pneumonica]
MKHDHPHGAAPQNGQTSQAHAATQLHASDRIPDGAGVTGGLGESTPPALVNGLTGPRVEHVDEAIRSRRSIRAFLPTPVPQQTVADMLSVASRAPSGSNIQPWQTYVLTGKSLTALTTRLLDTFNDPAQRVMHEEEYAYYPREWTEPYQARRRKVGWDLYGLLGIGREDKERMHGQHGRNFRFFDAPVGLIFTIDRHLEQGSWLDYGMFLQSIMVAARARGLDTCAQAAFAMYPRVIAEVLRLPESRMVVCGMALGYADPAAAENQLVTERAPLDDWAHFLN